ncbi:MAG: kinesin-related protein [Amphiamblys sp. WSBS2006]|nr:MAG: kinesin-related protein [Amphiamblys sp. WSBS2006]
MNRQRFYTDEEESSSSPHTNDFQQENANARYVFSGKSPLSPRRSSLSSPAQTRRKSSCDKPEEKIERIKSMPKDILAYGVPSRRRESKGRKGEKIMVCLRKRPLSTKEMHRGEKDVIEVGRKKASIVEPKTRVDMTKYELQHEFYFDNVFGEDRDNRHVYQHTARKLIGHVFSGEHAICFAYGQTGSGKTHTMLDPESGIYFLAAQEMLQKLGGEEGLYLTISFYEIYQGSLHDLLNKRQKLHAREDRKSRVCVSGLKEFRVSNVPGLLGYIKRGLAARATGFTAANADSSRSHAIFHLSLRRAESEALFGRFVFIDLAGSERGADREDRNTKSKSEGAEINKSLLALKECIRAIDQSLPHLPFRQSKLTQVIKESFTGNAKTCVIATVSPAGSSSEDTLNTLRYADRIKQLTEETQGGESEESDDTEMGVIRPDSEVLSECEPTSDDTSEKTESFGDVAVLDREIISHAEEIVESASVSGIRGGVYKKIKEIHDLVGRCTDEETLSLLLEELCQIKDSFSLFVR